MRKRYKCEDLDMGVRGKHCADYWKGSNVVLINPGLTAVFPTAKVVNEALRSLVQVAERVASAPKKRNNLDRPRRRIAMGSNLKKKVTR